MVRVLIAFQTNQNGNWDIVFRRSIMVFGDDLDYAADSPDDEENLKRVYQMNSYLVRLYSFYIKKTIQYFLLEFKQNQWQRSCALIILHYILLDYTGVY